MSASSVCLALHLLFSHPWRTPSLEPQPAPKFLDGCGDSVHCQPHGEPGADNEARRKQSHVAPPPTLTHIHATATTVLIHSDHSLPATGPLHHPLTGRPNGIDLAEFCKIKLTLCFCISYITFFSVLMSGLLALFCVHDILFVHMWWLHWPSIFCVPHLSPSH